MLVAAAVVYLDRGGYTDVSGKPLSVLDCVYFAVVSLTTIGYGDITPLTESARLINILLITPLRVAFLIVLVGTTVQVLAERQRKTIKIERWRKRVRNHTIVVGYGTKGRNGDRRDARATMSAHRRRRRRRRPSRARPRRRQPVWSPCTATPPDPTCCGWLAAQQAASIIVATGRDDTAVLVTLTAREDRAQGQDRGVDPGGENQALCCSNRARTRWWSPRRPPAGCSAWPPQRPASWR